MIKFEGCISDADSELEAIVDAIIAAVEEHGGAMICVWSLCDDDGNVLVNGDDAN